MILYATKQTVDRYHLDIVKKAEVALLQTQKEYDSMLDWSIKIFYFRGKKCVQCLHIKTKLTFYFYNITKQEILGLDQFIYLQLTQLFYEDTQLMQCITMMKQKDEGTCFASLHDRTAISSMNINERGFLFSGMRLEDYIEAGSIHLGRLNHHMNFEYILTRKEGNKAIYYWPAEYFREVMLATYLK
ncbi:MAG: DUF6933 domain-containing protein [Erysipelotrichaceae bacterium]